MAVDILANNDARLVHRSLQATSTGRLWVAIGYYTAAKLEFWYSDDAGATWAENTSAEFSFTGPLASFAFYIDQDDHAHVVYESKSSVQLNYRRNKSISTTSAWSAATTVDNTTANAYENLDLVAHREGTGWVAHVLYKRNTTVTDPLLMAPITVTSGDVITVGTKVTVASSIGAGTGSGGIDFHHTATNEKAIQGSTPHLYVVWSESAYDVKFRKYTYSGGVWTAGTVRTIVTVVDVGPSALMVFDGSRVLIIVSTGTFGSPAYYLYERDAADTTTTTRGGVGMPSAGALTYDNDGNVWIVGSEGLGSANLLARKFIRSTLAWDATLTVNTDAPFWSGVRRYNGNTIAITYLTGDYSPYRVRYDETYNNVAPSSPTWNNVDNVGADVGTSLVLDWNFIDANPADTQSAYTLRRQIGAGAYAYWKASDSSWNASVQKIVTATTAVTLASGWGADVDDNHKFAVLVYDDLDTVSPYSAELTVTPSTPSVPVITTPVDGSTHGSASLTAVWTCTSQGTYRVELLDSAGTSTLWDSGTLTSTSVRDLLIDYALVNGVSYKVRVTCTNTEGLTATPDTNSFSVSYTLPATPTLTATANNTTGVITVASAHPAPSGGQPTVTSAEVWVRCTTARTYADMERPVGGVGIRVADGLTPGVSWVDRACSSGVAYEYMVRGRADDGTFADSAWTA